MVVISPTPGASAREACASFDALLAAAWASLRWLIASIVLSLNSRAERSMILADLPAVPVGGEVVTASTQLSLATGSEGGTTEPPYPNRSSLDGLLDQCPRPTLHRLFPFLESPGHIRVGEPTARGISPAMRFVPARRHDPTPVPNGRLGRGGPPRGPRRPSRRPDRHESGQGPFHVEAVRLGASQGSEKWTVGGALTRPARGDQDSSPERSSSSSHRCC